MAERLRLALGLGRIRSRRELGRRPHRKQGTKEGEAKAGRRNRRKGHGKKIKGKYNSFHSRGGGGRPLYTTKGVLASRESWIFNTVSGCHHALFLCRGSVGSLSQGRPWIGSPWTTDWAGLRSALALLLACYQKNRWMMDITVTDDKQDGDIILRKKWIWLMKWQIWSKYHEEISCSEGLLLTVMA